MPKHADYNPYTTLDAQKKAAKKYQKDTNYQAIKKYQKTEAGIKASKKNILKQYGITPEEYNNKLVLQNHKCAICNIDEAELTTSLCVDHDHETGKVRDLLCGRCNVALGMFKENIDSLAKAISYLEKHK